VDRRLRHYHAEIPSLLDFYRRKGLLTDVDASQEAEAVTAAILRALDPAGR
jgi:adenylate kinase family enzyme